MSRRLILARDTSQADGEAVPKVNRAHGGSQNDKFGLAKVPAHLLVNFIRDMPLTDQRDGLGPVQSSPLPLRVKGSLSPSVEAIDPLFAFSPGSQVLRVHVETVSAAIDLRSSHPDQIQQRGFKTTGSEGAFHAQHCLVDLSSIGGELFYIDSRFHDLASLSGGVWAISSPRIRSKSDAWPPRCLILGRGSSASA